MLTGTPAALCMRGCVASADMRLMMHWFEGGGLGTLGVRASDWLPEVSSMLKQWSGTCYTCSFQL